MAAATQRYSLANPPPTTTPLTGRETAQEAEVLELQSLQAEHDGNDAVCVQLMERALQIRSRSVGNLGDQLQSLPTAEEQAICYADYVVACNALYDCAERLVVKCNCFGVESFKRGDYETATPLLRYGLDLTDEGAYPLREDDDRRRRLRGVTLNNLGCMQRRQGRFREALASMQESMDTTGVESPVAYMNMSAILIQLRLGEEAASMAQRAVDLFPSSAEDPSLLAVAHHNLAMALEPVDPVRCLQEYQSAHQIACATVGAESPTAISIQHNWQRYQRSHQLNSAAPFPDSSGSHNVVAMRGGGAAARETQTTPRPATGTSAYGGGDWLLSTDAESDIFPHPFVSSCQVPRQQQQRAAALANSVPMYRPRAPPRAATSAATAAQGTSSAKRPTPSTSGPFPRPPQSGTATAVTAAHPHPSTQSGAAAGPRASANPRQRLPSGKANNDDSEANAASTDRVRKAARRPSASHKKSSPPPPPARASAAQDRLQRFTAARASQDSGPVASPEGAASSRAAARVGGGEGMVSTVDGRQRARGGNGNVAQTFPGLHGSGGRGRLSPLTELKSSSPARVRPEANNYMSHSSIKKAPTDKKNTIIGKGQSPPRALPPIGSSVTEEDKAAGKSSSRRGDASANGKRQSVTFASAKDVSQFEKKGGDLVEYVADRLEMLLHDEEELERKYRKAVVIQRHYRGHLARRRLDGVRERRGQEERLRAIRRNMAARTIQRGFRGALRGGGGGGAAGFGPEQAAAVKLQSTARGWLARRAYRRQERYMRDSSEAAPRIQRWYRGCLARRELAERRTAKEAEEAAATVLERRNYAATQIQSAWRGHQDAQRRTEELALRRLVRQEAEADRRFAAARAIQCCWRSRQARLEYNRRLSQHLAREAQRKAYQQARTAAITLQAFARGIMTRNKTLPDLEKARHRAADAVNKSRRTHTAAVTIQNAYRGHLARRQLAQLRADRDALLRADRERVLAVLVQRVGRGFVARRALAVELADMEREAARYHRELAELQRFDACRRGTEVTAATAQALAEDEDNLRAAIEIDESKSRRRLAATRREERPPTRPSTPPPVTHQQQGGEVGGAPADDAAKLGDSVSTEDDAGSDLFFHSPPRADAVRPSTMPELSEERGTAHARAPSEVLEGFAKIIKAKQQVAERRSVLVASLESARHDDAVARREEAGAVLARFLRGAVATQAVRVRGRAIEQHLAQLASRDATEAAEGRDAEDSANASESSSPVVVGDEGPSAATRPASTVAEAEEDEYESLEAALAVERARRQREKEAEERARKARDDLINARQAHKLKKIGDATTTADLVPYTRKRIDLSRFKRNQDRSTTSVDKDRREAPVARPSSRQIRERAAGATIYRVYRGHQARRHASHLRTLRDEYLALLIDKEKVDGPILDVARVKALTGAYPPPHYAPRPVRKAGADEERLLPQPSEPAEAPALTRSVPPLVALEVAPTPRSTDDVLAGFVKVVEAKHEAAARRAAVEEAMRAAEGLTREASAGETIGCFMRLVAAKAERRDRAMAVARYLAEGSDSVPTRDGEEDAMDFSDTGHSGDPNFLHEEEEAALPAGRTAPTAPPSRVGSATEPSAPPPGPQHRPRTAEEVAAEHAALVRLGQAERTYAELDAEGDALRKLAERESMYCEAEDTLSGFVKVLRAKREAASRRASVAAHICALQAQDAEDRASSTITHFMRMAAAKRTRARRAEAVRSTVGAIVEAEQQQLPPTDLCPGGPSASPVAHEGCTLTVEDEEEEERRQLVRLVAREVELTEAQLLKELTAREAVLTQECAAETATADHSQPRDEGEDDLAAVVADAAAVTIQCFYRRHVARRELGLLREAQQQRLGAELMAEELLNGAAADIQRVFRGHLARKLLRARAQQRTAYLANLLLRDTEHAAEDGQRERERDTTGSERSSAGWAPDTAEGSTVAPSSHSDKGSAICDTPLSISKPNTGLTAQAVADAFPERYDEMGEPHPANTDAPADRPRQSSGDARRSSGSNSTAIIEEVSSRDAAMMYNEEL